MPGHDYTPSVAKSQRNKFVATNSSHPLNPCQMWWRKKRYVHHPRRIRPFKILLSCQKLHFACMNVSVSSPNHGLLWDKLENLSSLAAFTFYDYIRPLDDGNSTQPRPPKEKYEVVTFCRGRTVLRRKWKKARIIYYLSSSFHSAINTQHNDLSTSRREGSERDYAAAISLSHSIKSDWNLSPMDGMESNHLHLPWVLMSACHFSPPPLLKTPWDLMRSRAGQGENHG